MASLSIDGVSSRSRFEREEDVSRPSTAATSDSRAAADRLDALVSRGGAWSEQAAPAAVTCGYKTAASVAACPTETIGGAELFVKGAGDADAIDPNDVKQRGIGTCHLLGPTVAVAQSPEGRQRIREMVKERKDGDKTVYDVTFRIPIERSKLDELRGKPAYRETTVTVDGASFPKGHAEVGDSVDGKNEVWPLVLEAGYAKLRGGYEKINGGVGTVGLAVMTGKPAEEKTLESGWFKYDAKSFAKDAAAGKPLCVTFTHQLVPADGVVMPSSGAVGFHCYAVRSVYEKDGKTYVQLANPWGNKDPKPIPLDELERHRPQISIGQRP